MDYHPTSVDVQTFSVEPYLAIGKFVKVLLIGKLQAQQSFNNLYYHALSYVGVNASKVPKELCKSIVERETKILSIDDVKKVLEDRMVERVFEMRESLLVHSKQLI